MTQKKAVICKQCSAVAYIQKKRDCTVAVPHFEALELPLTLNKQHRSPRRYVRTHTHPHGAYGDRYTYPEDIKMLQCLGVI